MTTRHRPVGKCKYLWIFYGFLAVGSCPSTLFAGPPVQVENSTSLSQGYLPCLSYGLTSPFPSKEIKDVPFPVLAHYRQSSLLIDDPVGDRVLRALLKRTTKTIGWMIARNRQALSEDSASIAAGRDCATWYFGFPPKAFTAEAQPAAWSLPHADIDLIADLNISQAEKEKIIEGLIGGSVDFELKRRPLYNRGMRDMLIEVIQQEYKTHAIRPRAGDFHRWSGDFLKEHRPQFPKILVALAKGITSRFMVTEQETPLRAWMSSQLPDSIAIPELFRASYRLNQGNVYLSLLTIENVLSRDAWVSNRHNIPLYKNLSRITHAYGKSEDRFGAWYHLFGMLLYGYVRSGIESAVVGEMEGVGSLVIDRWKAEKQENSINRNAGGIGHSLRKAIANGTWEWRSVDGDALHRSHYLTTSRKRDKRLVRSVRK